MRRVSLRAILLLIFASCIFGVVTYASVKVSTNRNAFEAAFTDLTNIFGSLPGERHRTINATRRSSKGVNFRNPVIDASAGVGLIDASASQGWKADATALQPPSSLVTTHPADLSGVITQDDIYRSQLATVPFHSSSYGRPFTTSRSETSSMGFPGTAATTPSGSFISPGSTAGPGSAPGSNVNPGKCVPCVKPAPEPSWIVLVGTAVTFSFFWWATRTMRTWLSRRRGTHSGTI